MRKTSAQIARIKAKTSSRWNPERLGFQNKMVTLADDRPVGSAYTPLQKVRDPPVLIATAIYPKQRSNWPVAGTAPGHHRSAMPTRAYVLPPTPTVLTVCLPRTVKLLDRGRFSGAALPLEEPNLLAARYGAKVEWR